MHCTFCENAIAPGSRYCSHCGTAVMNPSPQGAFVNAKSNVFAGEGAFYPSSAHATVGVGVQSTSVMAIVSLLSGIAAWCIIPVIGAIVAVVTGHLAKREIRESGRRTDGEAMATIGLWLGYAQLLLVLLAVFIVAVIIVAAIPLTR